MAIMKSCTFLRIKFNGITSRMVTSLYAGNSNLILIEYATPLKVYYSHSYAHIVVIVSLVRPLPYVSIIYTRFFFLTYRDIRITVSAIFSGKVAENMKFK